MEFPQLIKTLSGHSGCAVELFKKDSLYFVRKTAPNTAYGERLSRQIDKQKRLSSFIPLPSVLNSELYIPNSYYDMEFVQGLDFKQFCLSRPITSLPNFLERLFGYFSALREAPRQVDLTAAYQKKIKSLIEHIRIHQSPVVRSLVDKIELLNGYDFSVVPCTECHGDMTLENIIFKNSGDFVFIDTLDGDLESVWMDIAKLLYDIEVSWTLRPYLWTSDGSPEHRLLTMISRYLAEELRELIDRHFPEAVVHLPVLKAIQALRVLPYTKDEQTILKLTTYIGNTLK